MPNPIKKATTIWFTSEEEWKNYLEAKRLLKESKRTVAQWFHYNLKRFLDDRKRKS